MAVYKFRIEIADIPTVSVDITSDGDDRLAELSADTYCLGIARGYSLAGKPRKLRLWCYTRREYVAQYAPNLDENHTIRRKVTTERSWGGFALNH